MSGGDWLAAFGLLLVIEGALPFAAPAMWREAFRRATEFTDGQLRFIGAAKGARVFYFMSALPRESDGCKARRAGKGLPLPSGATPQTRFLAATRRGGPIRAHPFVAVRLLCPHSGAACFAGCIPNRSRRRHEIEYPRAQLGGVFLLLMLN